MAPTEKLFPALLCALGLLAVWSNASPIDRIYSTFTSRNQEDVGLRYVADSGVCETTPGVHQMSGYIDIGKNMSTWFWFFEARESPDTAPFTLWMNGGPGCSSMIGLFQENGPCHVNPDGKTTVLNPYSWNSISNMIYIDQPIGTGFSYGTDTVNTTDSAAPFMWKAFQVLFESPEFSKYQSREFIFATESYGGHWGPSFITYFNEQNRKIQSGSMQGEEIVVSALMVTNGWYDPLIQNKAFVDFATYAPGYGQLQSDEVLEKLNESFYGANGCKEQEEACYAAGSTDTSNDICRAADAFCVENVYKPAVGDRDPEDLRQMTTPYFPPEYYTNFLLSENVKAKIGAASNIKFSECVSTPAITQTGDHARTSLHKLEALANRGLRMLILAGDADINCNWLGAHASVLAMNWYGKTRIQKTPFKNMTIDGKAVAAVQNLDNVSFARVYDAGHRVPAFQPQAALEMFRQIILGQQLHSVYTI